MIPKIIHYCWFGEKPLPPIVKKCIESWQRYLPSYQIMRWDETNVPYMNYDFMREAYENQKYAFVSDQARYWVMKQYGGLFLDTDVEVLRPLDELLENKCFFAFNKHIKKNVLFVNPGLIMGAEPNSPTINSIFEVYCKLHFVVEGQLQLQYSSPRVLTKYLLDHSNIAIIDKTQYLLNNITIYATDFFDPMDPRTLLPGSKIDITNNTFSIHHGAASWVPLSKKITRAISILVRRIFGDQLIDKLRGKEKQQ